MHKMFHKMARVIILSSITVQNYYLTFFDILKSQDWNAADKLPGTKELIYKHNGLCD